MSWLNWGVKDKGWCVDPLNKKDFHPGPGSAKSPYAANGVEAHTESNRRLTFESAYETNPPRSGAYRRRPQCPHRSQLQSSML